MSAMTISYEQLMKLKAINKAIMIGGRRIGVEWLGAVLEDASTVRDGFKFDKAWSERIEWAEGEFCCVLKMRTRLPKGAAIDLRAEVIVTLLKGYELAGITPVAARLLVESCELSGFGRRLAVNAITKYRARFYNEGHGVRSAWGLIRDG